MRIAQEALQNVVKHSGATMAIVRLVATARNIRLHVGDGGKGFDRTAHTGAGLGLLSIRERAHLAGGRVSIRTAIDGGTRIVATLPAKGESACQSPVNNQESGTIHLVRKAPPAPAATMAQASLRILTALGRGLLTRPMVGPTRPLQG